MASPASPASPKAAVLKGTFTIKVVRCLDLERKRLLGKMDPYVKINVGGSEKFKTKTAKDGDRAPVFEQTFLFNLTGVETDLHLKVYDNELLADTYIGRADINLSTLLSNPGARLYDLSDPENFRKITGHIEIVCAFEGTGGPAAVAEIAPIMGNFHFQSNATGFLLHPTSKQAGAQLVLKAGGMDSLDNAFLWQGQYLRACGSQGLYLTADGKGAEDLITLQAGISDGARWKWTGLGLQHVSSQKLMHPLKDEQRAGVPMVLLSGSNAASGFSLVECKGVEAAPAPTPAPAVVAPPPATNPAASVSHQMANMSVSGGWTCVHCTFKNEESKKVCDMCSKSRTPPMAAGVSVPAASSAPEWDLSFANTWPAHVVTTKHPHDLKKVGSVYQGTYNCDICRLQGQGIAYHCQPCGWDAHPACAKQYKKH